MFKKKDVYCKQFAVIDTQKAVKVTVKFWCIESFCGDPVDVDVKSRNIKKTEILGS